MAREVRGELQRENRLAGAAAAGDERGSPFRDPAVRQHVKARDAGGELGDAHASIHRTPLPSLYKPPPRIQPAAACGLRLGAWGLSEMSSAVDANRFAGDEVA